MSIDKLKKQSKNLLHLLPDFVQQHGSDLRLSNCQEFVARLHGYPNWNTASVRLDTEPSITNTELSDEAPGVTHAKGKTTFPIPGPNNAAHEEGVLALKRLFEIAQGSSGQCRWVAAFLLGLYNGTRFPFDLTNLRAIDTAIFDDCVRVLKMDASPRQEVHSYFPDGGRQFEKLAQRFRIPDMERLKSICEDIPNRGVISFGGEEALAFQIQHALASTWPTDD